MIVVALLLIVYVVMKAEFGPLLLCSVKFVRLNFGSGLSWLRVTEMREATSLASSLLEHGVSAPTVPWFAT